MIQAFIAEGYNFKTLEVVQDRVNKKFIPKIMEELN
jgi:hypothetical protein